MSANRKPINGHSTEHSAVRKSGFLHVANSVYLHNHNPRKRQMETKIWLGIINGAGLSGILLNVFLAIDSWPVILSGIFGAAWTLFKAASAAIDVLDKWKKKRREWKREKLKLHQEIMYMKSLKDPDDITRNYLSQ